MNWCNSYLSRLRNADQDAALSASTVRLVSCSCVVSCTRTTLRAPLSVRVLVRCHLESWGLSHLIASAELIGSELATNAIQHGLGDMIGVRLECSASSVVIRVWDANGEDLPQLREPVSGRDDEHGRGLAITEALSDDWDVYRVASGGKVVWARITEAMADDLQAPARV